MSANPHRFAILPRKKQTNNDMRTDGSTASLRSGPATTTMNGTKSDNVTNHGAVDRPVKQGERFSIGNASRRCNPKGAMTTAMVAAARRCRQPQAASNRQHSPAKKTRSPPMHPAAPGRRSGTRPSHPAPSPPRHRRRPRGRAASGSRRRLEVDRGNAKVAVVAALLLVLGPRLSTGAASRDRYTTSRNPYNIELLWRNAKCVFSAACAFFFFLLQRSCHTDLTSKGECWS
jgi:hypothetical protein